MEEEFQTSMRAAYKTASKTTKKSGRKRKDDTVEPAEKNSVQKGAEGKQTEFARRDDRRRVNDVAEAPPTLIRLPRKAEKSAVDDRMPVSGVQKRLMDEEREGAIRRYREMKQRQQQEREKMTLK